METGMETETEVHTIGTDCTCVFLFHFVFFVVYSFLHFTYIRVCRTGPSGITGTGAGTGKKALVLICGSVS